VKRKENHLLFSAGIATAEAARAALAEGLSGLEFAAGIPGTPWRRGPT